MSSIIITDGTPEMEPIRTQAITAAGVDRVIKQPGKIVPLEVKEKAVTLSAKHFMVIEPEKLGDVRHAGYFSGKNLVPAVVNNKDFLGSVEIIKYGMNREMFFKAVTFEFDESTKLKKPEKADVAHCWPLNDVTMNKIAENYNEGIYTLDETDRVVFDAYFELDEEKKRLGLEMEEGDEPPKGFLISTAFTGLIDSTSTLGRFRGTEAKRKIEGEKRDARLFEAEKRAKWVDSVTFTKTGQVTLHLNMTDADGKQKIVTATPLE